MSDPAPGGGFDALSGAPRSVASGGAPPAGIRTVPVGPVEAAARLVLVRHGEAVCNVSGVCGGRVGCQGLTERGVGQVEALRHRLESTGELAGARALYASELPRAIETAALIAPALRSRGPGRSRGPEPPVRRDCGLCELHPGEADGLTWNEFAVRFGDPGWDTTPDHPIAPGGESWTGFVRRVAATLETLAARHAGELVVVACHAGVVEASMLAMLPIVGGRDGARLGLATRHASMTTWEVGEAAWRLVAYNDASHLERSAGVEPVEPVVLDESAGPGEPAVQQA